MALRKFDICTWYRGNKLTNVQKYRYRIKKVKILLYIFN